MRAGWCSLASMVLVACGGSFASEPEPEWASVAPSDSGPPSHSSNDSDAPEGAAVAALLAYDAAPETIDLVDPGRAPRWLLRYTYRVRDAARVRMRVNSKLSVSSDGHKVVAHFPMQLDVTEETREVDAAGNARKVKRISNVTVLDLDAAGASNVAAARRALEEFVVRLEQISLDYVIDPRGRVREVRSSLTDAADESLRRLAVSLEHDLLQSSMSWPAQAVGAGARWTTRSRTKEGGIEHEDVCSFTLQRREGALVEVGLQEERRALEHEVPLPDGTVGQVESTGSGKGSFKALLDSPAYAMQESYGWRLRVTSSGRQVVTSMSSELAMSTIGREL